MTVPAPGNVAGMDMSDPTDTEGQERERAKNALNQKRARDTEKADLKWLMGSKRGRRIVRRWLEDVGVFLYSHEKQTGVPGTSFDANPVTMAYVEGRMSHGRKVEYLVLMACPEQFVLMQQEAKDDYRNSDNGTRED